MPPATGSAARPARPRKSSAAIILPPQWSPRSRAYSRWENRAMWWSSCSTSPRPRPKPMDSTPPAGTSHRSCRKRSAGSRRCSASGPTSAASRTWPRGCPTFTKKRSIDRMLLGEIADTISDSEVTGFALDHRRVAPGNIFGAFRGSRFNGEDFIAEAVKRGASAVVARPEARVEGVPHLAAAEPRRLFPELAAKFFAPYPDVIVAVTGTNGKTSTVELTRQLWRMAGQRSASIGTLGVTTADDQVKTGLTTPDIVTFLSNMAGMDRMGISHVAYEASSHGLDQYRAEGVPVQAAAFTTFSRDSLDYHPSMDAYFAAKMRLFDEVIADDGTAVIWTGDAKSA